MSENIDDIRFMCVAHDGRQCYDQIGFLRPFFYFWFKINIKSASQNVTFSCTLVHNFS